MDKILQYGIIAAVIVLLIIIYLVSTNRGSKSSLDPENYVYGHWIADSGFCDESEISSMQIFIGKAAEDCTDVERPAYILINNDIANQEFEIKYKKGKLQGDTYKVEAVLEFSDEIDIPEEVTLEFNIMKGRLRIHDDDTVYGIMYKDHEVSNMLV